MSVEASVVELVMSVGAIAAVLVILGYLLLVRPHPPRDVDPVAYRRMKARYAERALARRDGSARKTDEPPAPPQS